MNSREKILKKLHQAAHPVSHPEGWGHTRDFEDPVKKFTSILTAAKGEVILTGNREEANRALESLLEELEATDIVINDEAQIKDLPGMLPQYKWFVIDQSEGDLQTICEKADVGITTAEAAFAETGTLVLTSGDGKSRFTSLLPPVHIAMLPTSLLQSDIFAWEKTAKKDLPGWVGFISGPSKTGDIEGVLTLGVHGPKRFIVILYDA
jgi:L-lactate dehydrogenase complex protein LldG